MCLSVAPLVCTTQSAKTLRFVLIYLAFISSASRRCSKSAVAHVVAFGLASILRTAARRLPAASSDDDDVWCALLLGASPVARFCVAEVSPRGAPPHLTHAGSPGALPPQTALPAASRNGSCSTAATPVLSPVNPATPATSAGGRPGCRKRPHADGGQPAGCATSAALRAGAAAADSPLPRLWAAAARQSEDERDDADSWAAKRLRGSASPATAFCSPASGGSPSAFPTLAAGGSSAPALAGARASALRSPPGAPLRCCRPHAGSPELGAALLALLAGPGELCSELKH